MGRITSSSLRRRHRLLSWPEIHESLSAPDSHTVQWWACPLCIEWSSFFDSNSKRESYLSWKDLDEYECRLSYILSRLPRRHFLQRFDVFRQGALSYPEWEGIGNDSPTSLYVFTLFVASFHANSVLYLLSFMTVSVLRLMNVPVGAMNDIKSRSRTPSKTYWRLHQYLIISLHGRPTFLFGFLFSFLSRSNITCSIMLYTTDRMSLWDLLNDVCNMSSGDTSTMVYNSFATNSITATFTFWAINSSFSVVRLSTWRFSFSTGGSSLAAVAILLAHSTLWLFNAASYADIGTSSLVLFLTISNDGSREVGDTASAFVIGRSMSGCERVARLMS